MTAKGAAMGQKTKIAWCDSTLSVSYGCSGCEISGHCYAERMCHRFPKRYPGLTQNGKWTGKIQLNEKGLDIPLHWNRPRKIFVNSCGDLFAPGVSADYLAQVWEVMEKCPQHTFMILTKQPKQMFENRRAGIPLKNVWLGVSVTDQKTADQRTELLRQTPATVSWISAEPLLAPITPNLEGIGWLVAGGESGPGARPMRPEWVRSLRDQCQEAGVAFFFKSWGAWCYPEQMPNETFRVQDAAVNFAGNPDYTKAWRVGAKRAGNLLDGRTWAQFPEVSK